MDRFTGATIPDRGRLPLISDADGGYVAGAQTGAGERAAGDLELAGPNLARIMLDPSRLGKDLLEFLLGNRAHRARMVENDCAGAGRPLIQGQDEGHARRVSSKIQIPSSRNAPKLKHQDPRTVADSKIVKIAGD